MNDVFKTIRGIDERNDLKYLLLVRKTFIKRLLYVTLDLLVRGENVHKRNGIMLCNTIITVHK